MLNKGDYDMFDPKMNESNLNDEKNIFFDIIFSNLENQLINANSIDQN